MLDKYHPFRASVAEQASSSTSSLSESASTKSPSEDKTNSGPSLFSLLGKKTRIGLFILVGGIVCIGYQSLYDLMNPSSSDPQVEIPTSEIEQITASRSVDDARRSAGFFGRFFCKGAQRASFCR